MQRFHGKWQIAVVKKDSDWDQRVVVNTPQGPLVIPGRVGASHIVDAPVWEIHVEHNWGQGWRSNVRTVVAQSWTNARGQHRQLLRSKDQDWPGDTDENDLELRLVALDDGTGRRDEPARLPSTAHGRARIDDRSTIRRPATVSHCDVPEVEVETQAPAVESGQQDVGSSLFQTFSDFGD